MTPGSAVFNLWVKVIQGIPSVYSDEASHQFMSLFPTLTQVPHNIKSVGLYDITYTTLKYVFYGVIGPWMMLDIRQKHEEDALGPNLTDMPSLWTASAIRPETIMGDECQYSLETALQ